jgi:ABC-2 type transport system permease protein
VSYLTRDTPASDIEFFTYREYVGFSNTLLVFVALTCPDLLCPDRRQRVLPLYFSRPLTGLDYVLAKVGAMFAILFSFGFLPHVVLFIGQMLVSEDGSLTYAGDNLDVLWKVPLSVGLLSLFMAMVGMALASFSARRITAGAIIAGVFLVSSIVSAVLVGEEDTTTRMERRPDGGIRTTEIVREEPGSFAALINLPGLPLQLRDVIFLGHTSPTGPLAGVDGGGAAAAGVYVVVLLGAAAVLGVRYYEVER